MSSKRKSFATGALILAIGGLVGKIIGAFYRIPLSGLIGDEGIGYYQLVYPIYTTLLAISSAGLPTAVSRLVAQRVEAGREDRAKRVFHVALLAYTLLGAVISLGLVALTLLGIVGSPQLRPGLLAISGSIFCVSVISAYRGYFQGHQRMEPTTLSQLIEQAGKLVFGLYLATQWYQANAADATRAAVYGAAGAMTGVTISEALAMAYMMIQFPFTKGSRIRADKTENFGGIFKGLLAIAIPISIGAAAMPLINSIDSLMVTSRLMSIGMTAKEATGRFGQLTGYVGSLINMPAVITLALSTSLVPAITRALTARDGGEAGRSAMSGYKLALLIGLPASVGMYLLADPILALLYGWSTKITPEKLALSGQLLRNMSIAVLFLSIVQTATGVMQGYGKPTWPVIVLFISAAPKILLNYFLVAIPEINIMGATYSTIACYGMAAIVDTILMLRLTRTRFRVGDVLVRPLICAAGMALALMAFTRFVGVEGIRMTFVAIALAVVVYAVLIVVTGTLNRDDLAFLPGGRKLQRLMERLHVMR